MQRQVSILLVCIGVSLYVMGCGVEPLPTGGMNSEPSKSTDTSAVVPPIAFEEIIANVRSTDAATAAGALKALASDTNRISSNLPILLEEARTAREAPPSELVEALDAGSWSPSDTKGALLLAAAADSIRNVTNEDERTKAMGVLKPFVDEALQGRVPGVRPKSALSSYYHCVFEPVDRMLTPARSPAIDDILQYLQNSVRRPDADVRDWAAFLLTNAAYVMPDRREEILAYIAAELGEEKANESRDFVEYGLRAGGKPVDREAFLADVKTKSVEELADWLIDGGAGGNKGNLYSQVLAERLATSPNRTAIVLRLLSKPEIARFCSGYFFPGPMPEDASPADKEFVDELIRFLQAEIAKADEDETVAHQWAVTRLGSLAVKNPMEPKETRLGGGEVPVPYAVDRIVAVLLEALGSKNRYVRQSAASTLGSVCWVGESQARTILTGLTAIRDQIEKNYDVSLPDSQSAGRFVWSERPEIYVYGDVLASIREAEMAIGFFESAESSTGK